MQLNGCIMKVSKLILVEFVSCKEYLKISKIVAPVLLNTHKWRWWGNTKVPMDPLIPSEQLQSTQKYCHKGSGRCVVWFGGLPMKKGSSPLEG